jgi:hypothetical protein
MRLANLNIPLNFAKPCENYLYNFCYHLRGAIITDTKITFNACIEFDEGIIIRDAYETRGAKYP